MMLRACQPSDAPRICEIYNHYVRETVITFEEKDVSEQEMARRIEDVTHQYPWLVWEQSGSIAGYAYATAWKARSAYRFSVESTVYIAPNCTRRGGGMQLYRALVAELRRRNVHTVIGGIALPNEASIALHEKLGFAEIGRFKDVGWKLGRWVDVGYWQLIL
jgi:phosphinothricin acetyltransferase